MFYKFPSTPYIETDGSIVRSDKVLTLTEVEALLSKKIHIEEKIDGANLGISFDNNGNLLIQNRGSYLYQPLEGQWKLLSQWLTGRMDSLFDCLADEYILFGEWCYAKHSIYYNKLPDWFLAFDVYDIKHEAFLSVEKRDHFIKYMKNIEKVPYLGTGQYTIDELRKMFGKSRYGTEQCEGIYIRQDKGDFLKYRAKMVRKGFKQGIEEHWSRHGWICNRIMR